MVDMEKQTRLEGILRTLTNRFSNRVSRILDTAPVPGLIKQWQAYLDQK